MQHSASWFSATKGARAAISPAKALRIIREETARGWRDPHVAELFLKLHKDVISKADQFMLGSDRSLDAMRAALLRMQVK